MKAEVTLAAGEHSLKFPVLPTLNAFVRHLTTQPLLVRQRFAYLLRLKYCPHGSQ